MQRAKAEKESRRKRRARRADPSPTGSPAGANLVDYELIDDEVSAAREAGTLSGYVEPASGELSTSI